MAEENIQLTNVQNLSNLENVDFSGGYACDMETGICGPIDQESQEKTEENKNENNDLV